MTTEIVTRETTTNPYLLALKSECLCTMLPERALVEISGILSRAQSESGRLLDEKDHELLCQSVLYELGLVFKQCTVAEFALMVRNGIRGQYGTFYSLTVIAINNWINCFIKSAERRRAKQLSQSVEAAKVMSPEEAHEAWRVTIIAQFDEYKKRGRLVIHFPGYLYKQYVKRGMIDLSTAKKKEIYDKALLAVANHKTVIKSTSRRVTERAGAREWLERMEKKALLESDKFEVQQEAKAITIREYYDSISELPL